MGVKYYSTGVFGKIARILGAIPPRRGGVRPPTAALELQPKVATI
jgi:hypothetical protein